MGPSGNLFGEEPRPSWGEYYEDTNYSNEAFKAKKETVRGFIEIADPKNVWDLGANTGEISRPLKRSGAPDSRFRHRSRRGREELPKSQERKGKPVCCHSFSICETLLPQSGGETRSEIQWLTAAQSTLSWLLHWFITWRFRTMFPLNPSPVFFRKVCRWLIIEFVPKSDSQVQRLLATREDIFPDLHHRGIRKGLFGILRYGQEGTDPGFRADPLSDETALKGYLLSLAAIHRSKCSDPTLSPVASPPHRAS